MSAHVQFRLLGPVEVVRDGVVTPVGGPRERALLALLLVHPGGLAAGELADRLWRGDPPPGAANTLQGYVSRVRRALGPTGRDLLVTRRPGYVLDVPPADVDARRVERQASAAQAALDLGDRVGALTQIDAALAAWRGEALEELADEEWATAERARLGELRARLHDLRVDVHLDLGHGPDLVADLVRAVADEPLREHRSAQLMVALHRSGRQAEALEVASRLRRLLGEELGIVPGAEVGRLHDAIVRQDAGLDGAGWRVAGSPARSPIAPAVPPPWSPSPSIPDGVGDLPFVGRVREQRRLVEVCDGARAGRGGVVIVRGEPGVGKTGLVESVIDRLGADLRVLRGRGVEGEAVLPHWLWSQALEPIVDATTLAGEPALARLWPHLATRLPAPDDAAVERARLDDAVVRVLAAASAERPILLVLDDLQWADGGSLRCLRYVAQRAARLPVAIVAVARSTEVGDDLRATIARLVREPRAHLVDLAGLGLDDVEAYLTTALGGLSAEAVAPLHQRTGGNPFFVEAVVRQARDAGPVDRAGDGWVREVPATAREVIRDRCLGLGGEAAEVLEVGALIGRAIDVRVVADAVGRPPRRVGRILDAASAAGLLVADPAGPGRFRFAHDLVLETMAAGGGVAQRPERHRRIATALAAERERGGPVESGALAVHLRHAAADGTGVDEAAEAALVAAREAIAALAVDEAIDLLEGARDLVASRGGLGPRHLPLLLELGQARWLAGATTPARQTFVEAAELAFAAGEDEGLADAMIGFSGGFLRDWHATRGQYGQRISELLEAAVARLDPDDGLRRAQLLSLWSEEHYFDRDPGPRLEASAEAVATARATGDDVVLAVCLAGRATATWGADTEVEREEATDELMAVAARLADPEPSLCALHHRFTIELGRGRTAEARRLHEAYARRADEARLPLHRWQAAFLHALLALVDGDLGVAEDRIDAALELGSQTDDPDILGVWGSQIALVRVEQGRIGELADALRSYADDFPESPMWRAAVCYVDVELGDLDAARHGLDRLAADDFALFSRDFTYVASLCTLGTVAARLGDLDRARVLHRLLVPYRERHVLAGDRHTWGSALLHLAILESALGDPTADARFLAAADHNRAIGATTWLAHTWAEHVRHLVGRAGPGDRRRAEELETPARALATERGLVRVLRTLDEALA